MKQLFVLAALLPTIAYASTVTVYRCDSFYTDDSKLCNHPVVLTVDAPPKPVDVQRTCTTNPESCVITKESK